MNDLIIYIFSLASLLLSILILFLKSAIMLDFTEVHFYVFTLWLISFLLFMIVFVLKLLNVNVKFITKSIVKFILIFTITFNLTVSILYITKIIKVDTISSNDNDSSNKENSDFANKCNVNATLADTNTELLKNNDFSDNYDNWYTHAWYNAADDQYMEISHSDGVVNFTTEEGSPNSRVGLMQDVDLDVSQANSIKLRALVRANEASLPGTGMQGREAPITIVMVYYDKDCTLHNLLPEDPHVTEGRIFWHGFYYSTDEDFYLTNNGTQVDKGTWYEYEVDLSDLDVGIIVSIAIGGAGWAPRSGSIDSISLTTE